MCDLHIRLNYFARHHGHFQPSTSSLCFLKAAQSCLRFPDLLPTCLPHSSSRHPSSSFSLRLLSADRGCCASRLLFFLAFEFLPPEPGLQNFGTCLRTSNAPPIGRDCPDLAPILIMSRDKESERRHASAALGGANRCSCPLI